MKYPKVICHMLTSMNGKIDGDYMSNKECTGALKAYNQIRTEYDAQATIYGWVTMRVGYASGVWFSSNIEILNDQREDHIALHTSYYIVSLDPMGTLAFDSNFIERKGRPSAHIIQVVSNSVSDAYLSYLRDKNISYIISESEKIDCCVLLEKLRTYFNIEKVMIAGGGLCNDSFLQQGLIDEISLVIAPISESEKSATSFEAMDHHSMPKSFHLADVKRLDGDAVWLVYKK